MCSQFIGEGGLGKGMDQKHVEILSVLAFAIIGVLAAWVVSDLIGFGNNIPKEILFLVVIGFVILFSINRLRGNR